MHAHALEEANLPRLAAIRLRGRLRKRIQMSNQATKVFICRVRFKPQLMLERDGEGGDQIESRHFTQEVSLPSAPVLLIIPPLPSMHPNHPAQCLTRRDKLRPILSPLIVPLISRGGAEGQTERDDETGDG